MTTGLRTILLCLITALAAPAPLPPAPSPDEPVTHRSRQDFSLVSAHILEYGVEWRLVRAGAVRVTWTPTAESGYQADLHIESAGLVSKLYRVNDDYRALLSPDLCGKTVFLKAEEGKRRRETNIAFDGSAGKISYLERDLLKNTTILSKELQTPPCVHEYLGALHRIRGMRIEPGSGVTVPLTDGKKFANVKVDAQEREQVKTPAGTFSTIRYEIHLFNDVIIPRKARMYVWLTDDARRLPVQLRIRMQFLIGTITLQLEKEETPKETRP